jgi:hypothetical protein
MLLTGKQIPAIWGGLECTINRVGDLWIDQLEMSGHYSRKNDLEAIAALGIKTLRYPVLWEHHQPSENLPINFSWASVQLEKMRALGITPIIGLLHHGSGPAFTNLLDVKFPEKLAAFAGEVAKKFPWVEYYTPVNEPLTTARFSGLYGLWYPHKNNDVSCIKMLLNQLKGTILSMQAIRKINPSAKLIQTEDLSKTYSTALLSYQARFENHRRWLTFDILCGRLVKDHALWNYFRRLGIHPDTLQFFVDNAMPPDIMPRFENIHYLGSKTYNELPTYLAGWDITMIPFEKNDSTKYISPTKTPEYLAAGKPVVSSSIRDVVVPYGEQGLVHIADTPEEFILAVEKEINTTDKTAWAKKVDLYLANISWDKTWSKMMILVKEILPAPKEKVYNKPLAKEVA